jgi:hypothetical protein
MHSSHHRQLISAHLSKIILGTAALTPARCVAIERHLSHQLLTDLLLKKMFGSLDQIVLRYRDNDTEKVGAFVESIIELCQQNDRLHSLDDIFKNFYS